MLRHATLACFLVLFISALAPVSAQPFVIDEAASGGSPNADTGEGIALADDGSRYVVGTFEGTATFGDVSITSAGDSDIFLVKYDAGLNAVWARRAGTDVFNDFGESVAVGPDGSVYATGFFTGIATWDGGENPDVELTTFSDFDAFVAKYTPEGDLEWVRQAGGTGQDTGRDVAVDATGNVYLVGGFEGVGTFGTETLTSAGSSDAFLVKYDPDGDVVWARRGGSDQGDLAYGVAVTDNGAAHVSGSFRGVAQFGGLPIQSAGATDVFVVQHNADGAPVWIESIGADGSELTRGGGIGLDADDNVYVTGSFSNTILVASDVLESTGFTDVFVAKLSAEGDELWGRRGGGNGTNFSAALTVDASGNVLTTGYVDGTGTFADEPIATQGRDGYFAVLDSAGNLITVNLLGGTGQDAGASVAVSDALARFAATGSFRGTATFGDLDLTSTGSSDAYVIGGPTAGDPVPSTLFVDADATGAETGLSWADAFTDLQDALALAATLDEDEIQVWVTEAIYVPTKNEDPSIAFEVPSGIKLYGGFDGTETTLEERPVSSYTVLSGNIDDDANLEDNSEVVLRITGGTDEPISIDRFAAFNGVIGLEVSAGPHAASVVLNRVVLSGNHEAGFLCEGSTVSADTLRASSNRGVGIRSNDCTLSLSRSQVVGNTSVGIEAAGDSLRFIRGFIAENTGGGVHITQASQVSLYNVFMFNNSSSSEGGVLRIDTDAIGSSVEVANSLITTNSATTGGAVYLGRGSLRLVNTTVSDNDASSGSGTGGVAQAGGTLEVANSILWGNAPASFSTSVPTSASLSHSIIDGGCPSGVSCSSVLDTDPLFVDETSYGLGEESPAVDFGLTELLPLDTFDLDDDGNTEEPLPVDLGGRSRIQGNEVDLGTFESPFAVALEPGAGVPATNALGAAYPNPFRDRTTLALDVALAQDVTVEMFDVLGRRVATVHDGPLDVGQHRVVIEAGGLPASVYVVRAEGETFRFAQRVTLIR